MLKNYLIVAGRHLLKNRLYTLIGVIGLALAMTCCLLLAVLIIHEVSFDRFHAFRDRLCKLAHMETLQTGEQVIDTEMAPLGPILREDISGIEECVRTYSPDVSISSGDRSLQVGILCADQRFFEVFSFPLVQGDSTKVLLEPRSIVLSETAARKWFGDDKAVGASLLIQGAIPVTITGIMQDIPANSSIRADYVVPFRLLKEAGLDIDQWMGADYTTYLLLARSASRATVERNVDARCRGLIGAMSSPDRKMPTWIIQPVSQLHLHGLAGQGGRLLAVRILVAVALVILLLACINFVNLSIARSMGRAREAGLRKTLGAQRRNLILQFTLETALQVAAAMAIAAALTELLLPLFNQMLGTDISWRFGTLLTALLLVLAIVVVSLLAGLYPAVHFSLHSASAMLRAGGSKTHRAIVRKVLVVGQFILSIILTACALVLARQIDYIATKDLGFARNRVYGFRAPSGVQAQFDSFRQELLKAPGIKDVAFAAQNIANISSSLGPNIDWDGRDPDLRLEMHMDWVSYEYAQTLGLTITQGRFYSRDYPADAVDGIVLNERAVALMGLKDPVGKRFRYWGKDKRIIGVVQDFFFEPIRTTVKPMVLILGKSPGIIYVRVTGDDIGRSLAGIVSAVKSVDPGATVEILSFDDASRFNYELEYRLQSIGRPAVALSIILAIMGLFGLSAYAMARRTRELGIRRAFGASRREQLVLLSREPLVLVLISNAIACPVAYIVGIYFMSMYAYHASLGIMPFLFAAALTFIAAATAIGYHSVKAARANPVDSLKYE